MLTQKKEMNTLKISGIGHYFPGEPIGNSYFEKKYDYSDEWIREHTGVEKRHWADNSQESFVDLAASAVKNALKNAKMCPEEIDVLICTSSTVRPVVNPSTTFNKYMDIAAPLQNQVGLKNAFCYDLTGVACVGFIDATAAATSLLKGMKKKNALVVCVESPKNVLNFKYKNSCLFGAGAVATIWTNTDNVDSSTGLIDIVLHSDGSYFSDFDIDEENKIFMKGKAVGSFAPKALTDVSKEILEKNGISLEDIDWVIPHQANINIINQMKDAMKIPEEKILTNIERRGNTSSVGGPSCFSEYVQADKIKRGDVILISSFGRGYNWGSILFKY